MNFLRNRKQRKNSAGKGNSGRRNLVIGYGALTLAVIWSAALLPGTGEFIASGAFLGPLLLTLFILAIGLILMKDCKKDDYEE